MSGDSMLWYLKKPLFLVFFTQSQSRPRPHTDITQFLACRPRSYIITICYIAEGNNIILLSIISSYKITINIRMRATESLFRLYILTRRRRRFNAPRIVQGIPRTTCQLYYTFSLGLRLLRSRFVCCAIDKVFSVFLNSNRTQWSFVLYVYRYLRYGHNTRVTECIGVVGGGGGGGGGDGGGFVRLRPDV